MEFSEGEKKPREICTASKKRIQEQNKQYKTLHKRKFFLPSIFLQGTIILKLGHIIFNSYTPTYKNSNSNDSYNSLESMWSQEITSVKPIFSFTGDVENSSFRCPECY